MSTALPGGAPSGAQTGFAVRLKRIGLLSAMTLATLNAWTGSPLMALWVGSRVQGQGPPSMAALAVVALTMGTISVGLIKLLGVLGDAYDRLTGRSPAIREHTPWLRSMRDGKPREAGGEAGVSALDAILVTCVLLAVAAFEIWFFFYSSSPIDSRSGR